MSICFAITDADWGLTKDVFGIIGTLVSAAGVWVAGRIGFEGLKTWRRQSKGASDHDLSRRLLLDLYNLRDCVSVLRSPVMLVSESAIPPEQLEGLNFQQRSYRHTAYSYQQRFVHLDEVRSRLRGEILESEVVWGEDVKSLYDPIMTLTHELWMYVRAHLVTINPDEADDMVKSYRGILAKRRDVLYESPLEGEDEFKKDLIAALTKLEEYLKPKLIS